MRGNVNLQTEEGGFELRMMNWNIKNGEIKWF